MFLPLSVCLSVSKIIQKRVHEFGWNVACRQNVGTWTNWLTFEPESEYSPEPIRNIVRMPEPDCLLRYRINDGTRNFTSGKSHVYVDDARKKVVLYNLRQGSIDTFRFWCLDKLKCDSEPIITCDSVLQCTVCFYKLFIHLLVVLISH